MRDYSAGRDYLFYGELFQATGEFAWYFISMNGQQKRESMHECKRV